MAGAARPARLTTVPDRSPPLAAATALVAAGGAVGAALRSLAPGVDDLASLPWPTLAVNIGGAFALGLLLGRLRSAGDPGWVKPLLGTGVLGGFTTFSTFAVQTAERLPGDAGVAGAYAVLTVVGAVAAAAAGLILAAPPARRDDAA